MPTPESASEFLRLTEESGVVEKPELEKAMKLLSDQGADISNASTLASSLVSNQTLTRWQAGKLLEGRHQGFTLGKYRLLSLLGKGSMGTVYLAEHTMMRRRVALKVLPFDHEQQPAYLDRFFREARAVASLDHANIVRAYDVGKEHEDKRDVYYLAMEYINGQDLQKYVKENGALNFVRAANLMRQAARGLSHAHDRGLTHRDVKPGNLLLDSNDVVKILDLGLAVFHTADQNEKASLTVSDNDHLLGTADYISPELARNSHNVDHRTDIYGLGCAFYFMLATSDDTPEPEVSPNFSAWQELSEELKQDPAVVLYLSFHDLSSEGIDVSKIGNEAGVGSSVGIKLKVRKKPESTTGRWPETKALRFDGGNSGQYLTVNEFHSGAFNISGSLSVLAWFKVNKFTVRYQCLISKGDYGFRLARHAESSGVAFAINRWGNKRSNSTEFNGTAMAETHSNSSPVDDARWHLAVGVVDADSDQLTVSLFLDGELRDSRPSVAGMDTNTAPVLIGADSYFLEAQEQKTADGKSMIAPARNLQVRLTKSPSSVECSRKKRSLGFTKWDCRSKPDTELAFHFDSSTHIPRLLPTPQTDLKTTHDKPFRIQESRTSTSDSHPFTDSFRTVQSSSPGAGLGNRHQRRPHRQAD